MNWRYFYIGSVVALSYVLFLSWNSEKEIKQEFAEASAIEQSQTKESLPPGETEGLVEIQNSKLLLEISPTTGRVWQARLKEHTYLNNKDSLGVRLFGFEGAEGFKFYLSSGFGAQVKTFKVVEILPSSVRLLSMDGMVSKEITLKTDDYELLIKDRWVGQLP